MSASTLDNAVLQSRLIAIRQGLQQKFSDGLEDLSEGPLMSKLVETVRSTGRSEEYEWLTDFAFVKEWKDERSYNDFKAYAYSIPNRDWEITIAVKKNDIEDGRLGLYQRRIDRLVQNFNLHRRELLVQLINSATTDLCYDGTPFFNAAHPIYQKQPGGDYVVTATQSNIQNGPLTADSAGMANVQAMITRSRLMRADNGKRLNTKVDTMVVPTSLEWVAKQLAEDTELPDVNNPGQKVRNLVKGTFEVIVEDDLIDQNAWMMFDASNPVVKPFIYQIRQEPRFDGFDATSGNIHLFMHKEFLFGADARYNFGYGLYQGAQYSTGL